MTLVVVFAFDMRACRADAKPGGPRMNVMASARRSSVSPDLSHPGFSSFS